MNNIFLVPPVAFLLLLLVSVLLNYLFSKCAFRKTDSSEGGKDAYSCGEEFSQHLSQPDYSQFFPFAFFFTVLHVVAMIIATIPMATQGTFSMATVYIIGATVGMFILLKK